MLGTPVIHFTEECDVVDDRRTGQFVRLATTIIDVNDLTIDDYVVLPDDVEEEGVGLLIAAGSAGERPTLWRVNGWVDHDGEDADDTEWGVLRLDRPEGVWFELEITRQQAVRFVLPGQNHHHWA